MKSTQFEVIPDRYRLLYSQQQISQQIERIAIEIDAWGREVRNSSGQDLLVFPILRGGMFFFVDLVRALRQSVEVRLLRVMSYAGNQQQRENVDVVFEETDMLNRHILVVDDICDSGRTQLEVSAAFKKQNAAEVKSAVLVRRLIPQIKFTPTWSCFEFEGDDWLVGCGMDDSERYRNLSDLYRIIR